MSKTLEASCVAGVVTTGLSVVPAARVLSEGVSASDGILILDEEEKVYIAKTSGDLKTTLEKIASALGSIASALTTLDGKPLGTLAPLPAAVAEIAQVTALQAELTALSVTLR